ncbi:ankyrin repeat domain-containing protein [Ralstonia solanacearum]|uniref:ankyrin repeat domain-containing protein n=1 Tax=Ralstonia solanacearum TaxID=305 RepID=UPI0007C99470|nr:ankyrin repeat domain-containing protein [Ralstonia solanacearum]OAI58449.1 ankyrin [Ralstonia solanacearum]
MMQRVNRFLFALVCLAATAPVHAESLSPAMQRLCNRVDAQPFAAPGAKVRIPADPLLAAITTTDNAETIKLALGTASPDAPRGQLGTTPLVYAVSVSNWSAAKVLIAAGANINQVTKYGETPLERAIGLMRGSIACQLIAQGAVVPPFSTKTAYWLPLAAAVSPADDAVALVSFLLARGYDVNGRLPPANQTALHVAAERGNVGLVRLLVKHGATLDAQTMGGETAQALAKRAGQNEILQLLTAQGPVSRTQHRPQETKP